MDWIFDYSVMLANGDGDSGEWTEALTEEEKGLVLDAIIDGEDIEELMEQTGITNRVYESVMADVGSDLMDSVDTYEADEDLSYVFDEGCDVEITPEEPDLTDDKLIEQLIKQAVRRSKYEGTVIVHDTIEQFGKLYSDDPDELALGFAVNLNAKAYLQEYRKKAAETAEAEVIAKPDSGSGKISSDAVPVDSETRFLRCRFAIRADNWKIISFTKDFQNEVFQTLLDENDLEREDVIAFLDGSGEEPQYKGDLKRTVRAIGVYPYNGDAAFENMIGEDGAEVAELIDWLGIETRTDRSGDAEIFYID